MAIASEDEAIKELVESAWDYTVVSCNSVLKHAHMYGIRFMEIPDPNVRDIHELYVSTVLPLLDQLSKHPAIVGEHCMNIIDVQQFILHIRHIVAAIDRDNEKDFKEAVEQLSGHPHLAKF